MTKKVKNFQKLQCTTIFNIVLNENIFDLPTDVY